MICVQEQAVEREHERDEFQQEIKKLETQLRQSPGVDNKGLKVRAILFILQGVMFEDALRKKVPWLVLTSRKLKCCVLVA